MPEKRSFNRTALLKNVRDAYFSDTPIADQASQPIDLTNINKDIYLPALPAPPNAINLAEKNDEMFKAGLGRTWDLVKNILPYNPDTGEANVDLAGPVMVGKAGAKNAQRMLERLVKVNENEPQTLAGQAVRFLREKYPGLNRMMKSAGGDFGKSSRPSSNFGEFSPAANQAIIFDRGAQRPIPDYVNTGAHELTHGYQWNQQGRIPELTNIGTTAVVRDPKTKRVTMALGEGKYIQPELTASELTDESVKLFRENPKLTQEEFRQKINKIKQQRFQDYLGQQVEVDARQGGRTGQKAWENFVDQVTPDPMSKPFDVTEPLTREDFKNVMQDAIFKQYKEQLEAASAITDPKAKADSINYINMGLKRQLDSAARSLTGKYSRPISRQELYITPSHLDEILKTQGYTSRIFPNVKTLNSEGKLVKPLQTIEDILKIDPALRFDEPPLPLEFFDQGPRPKGWDIID